MRTILVLSSFKVAKRAFYNLPNVKLSTAAVFEFIGGAGGVPAGAYVHAVARADARGAWARREIRRSRTRVLAVRELFRGCGVAEVNPTTTDG
jgi:hypothetical protein